MASRLILPGGMPRKKACKHVACTTCSIGAVDSLTIGGGDGVVNALNLFVVLLSGAIKGELGKPSGSGKAE